MANKVKRINRNLGKLSDGERLWFLRTKAGKSQRQAAMDYGTFEKRYWEMEVDQRPFPGEMVSIIRLTPADKCALARRRAGLKLRGTARSFGVSHVTLLAWESSGDKRLIAHWRAQGFKF